MAGNLAQQFQSILGRNPTPDEEAYFQKFMDSGYLQAHEIGQVLQSTPEFQQTQLNKDTEAFGAKLQANDDQVLQRGADVAGAQAQSRFAGLGRPNSSALAASVFGQTGQLAGQLAQSRQSALASFYGQGLQAKTGMMASNGAGMLNRGYGLVDEQRQRDQMLGDYYRQQNDYHNELKSAGTRALQSSLTNAGISLVTGGLKTAAGAPGVAGAAGSGLWGK